MSYTVVRDYEQEAYELANVTNRLKRHCKIGKVARKMRPDLWLKAVKLENSHRFDADKHFRRVPHPPGQYTNYLIELGRRNAPLVR